MPSTSRMTPDDVFLLATGQTLNTKHVFTKKLEYQMTALAVAVAEHAFAVAEGNILIKRIVLISSNAFTGNAACYQWKVKNKGVLGTGTTVIVDFAADTATTDNLVAFVPKVLYAPVNPLAVKNGETLSIEVIKNGSPANFDGVLIVEYVPAID